MNILPDCVMINIINFLPDFRTLANLSLVSRNIYRQCSRSNNTFLKKDYYEMVFSDEGAIDFLRVCLDKKFEEKVPITYLEDFSFTR